MDRRLYYLGAGPRRYETKPVLVYGRPYWEFQAVIKGRIGPVLESGPTPFQALSLWVFEPDCRHGWSGPREESAEVIVFHLPPPDAVLRKVIRAATGLLRVSLTNSDIDWLVNQRDRLRSDWMRPTEHTPLRVDHLLSGLSLMILERSGYQPPALSGGLDRERVENALYWYRQNLSQHPGVPEVANAVGVSAVHLRRLFQKEHHQSPKAAFQAIRLDQARAFLSDPRVTVEAAAAEFGFSDASAFTRAYRQQFGHPPRRL